MKKVSFILIVLFCLTACGKYKDYDFIDEKDPVDERAVIEQAMDEQRTIMKPGFITERYNIENGFDLSFQSTYYNQKTEELRHRVNVTHAISDAFLAFETEKNTSEERYEEKLEEMNDAKPLDNHTGYVGLVEEDGEKRYDFAIEEDDTFYFFERGRAVEEGYDEELVKLLGESLKTEEEGAYSYFYDRFKFHVDELHFPLMSKDAVENIEVEINDLGYWAFDNPNTINVTYDLGDETVFEFAIRGMEMYANDVGYSEVDQEETEDGIVVTTYDNERSEQQIYAWEADDSYYAISIAEPEKASLSTDDIYAIIDSSRDDERSFSNKDLFTQQLEEPQLEAIDEEILNKLEEMGD